MPAIKREDWIKLSPEVKLMHRIQRQIDQTHALQARYDRGRVPVTVVVHVVPDTSHVGPLFKNIAIMGALLLIWARGPGAYALDGRASS